MSRIQWRRSNLCNEELQRINKKAGLLSRGPESAPAATHLVLRSLSSRILHKASLSSSVHIFAGVIDCYVASSPPKSLPQITSLTARTFCGSVDQNAASRFHRPRLPLALTVQRYRSNADLALAILSEVRLLCSFPLNHSRMEPPLWPNEVTSLRPLLTLLFLLSHNPAHTQPTAPSAFFILLHCR
jgi:hypothetical protein